MGQFLQKKYHNRIYPKKRKTPTEDDDTDKIIYKSLIFLFNSSENILI